MKKFVVLVCLIIISCKEPQSNIDSNIRLVQKYYEAVNNGRTDNAKEIVSDNFSKVNNGLLSEETGVRLFVTSVNNHIKDNKEYKFIVEDIFGAENKVAVRWRWKSINIKTGSEKNIESAGLAIFEISDDKINKLLQCFDLQDFNKQLSGE